MSNRNRNQRANGTAQRQENNEGPVKIERKSDIVAIVGLARSGLGVVDQQEDGIEMWSLNQGHGQFAPEITARFTRWFQIHPWEAMAHRQSMRPGAQHLEFLKTAKIPIYLEDLRPEEVPSGVRYPYEEVVEDLGGTYFTSVMAYMIALAIHEKFKEIRVIGIDVASNTEYMDQRPCLEYLLGIARARGIKVWLAPGSPLLKGPVYAKTVMVSTANIERRMKEMTAFCNNQMHKWQQRRGELRSLQYVLGIIDDSNPQGKSHIEEKVNEAAIAEQRELALYHLACGSVKMCEEFLSTALKANYFDELDVVIDGDGRVHFQRTKDVYCKPDLNGFPSITDPFMRSNLLVAADEERGKEAAIAAQHGVDITGEVGVHDPDELPPEALLQGDNQEQEVDDWIPVVPNK